MSQVPEVRLDSVYRNKLREEQQHNCYSDKGNADLQPCQDLL
jgi:hypothetical protein